MMGLDAFSSGLATTHFTDLISSFEEFTMMTAANSELRYSGKAYFDKEFREVRFWRSGNRGQIDIDGVPACQIDFEESHIHVLNCERRLGESELSQNRVLENQPYQHIKMIVGVKLRMTLCRSLLMVPVN